MKFHGFILLLILACSITPALVANDVRSPSDVSWPAEGGEANSPQSLTEVELWDWGMQDASSSQVANGAHTDIFGDSIEEDSPLLRALGLMLGFLFFLLLVVNVLRT